MQLSSVWNDDWTTESPHTSLHLLNLLTEPYRDWSGSWDYFRWMNIFSSTFNAATRNEQLTIAKQFQAKIYITFKI